MLGARENNPAVPGTIKNLIAQMNQEIDTIKIVLDRTAIARNYNAQKKIKQLLKDYIFKPENFSENQLKPFVISDTTRFLWYWGIVLAWGNFPSDVNFNGILFLANGAYGWHFWHSNDGRENDWNFRNFSFYSDITSDPVDEP